MNEEIYHRVPDASSNTAPRIARPIVWISTVIGVVCTALLCLPLLLVGAHTADTNRQKIDATFARVSAAWLSDRLALIPKERRISYLHSAAERMGVRAGLFAANGENLDAGPLATIPRSKILEVMLSGDRTLALRGETHHASASTLRPPLSSLTVITTTNRAVSSARSLSYLMILLIGAILMLASAALVAACFGLDFRSQLTGLAHDVRLSVQDPDGLSLPTTSLGSFGEMDQLAEAIVSLRTRFEAEMAIHLDARDEVEMMDGQRSDLLSAVAVDLYAPLDQIVVLTEDLRNNKEEPLNDAQEEDLRIIQQAAGRLRELVSEIVDLSALMGGEIRFDEAPVKMAEVAREVVDAARGQVGKKVLDLSVNTDFGSDYPVLGNRRRLWQLLTNLVSNAIKFTESGSVNVKVRKADENRIVVEVTDTGIGIAAININTVFDPFHQLGGRSGRKHGTGLGLAICKQIAEMHGGEISVFSIYKKGSTFTVSIPEAE